MSGQNTPCIVSSVLTEVSDWWEMPKPLGLKLNSLDLPATYTCPPACWMGKTRDRNCVCVCMACGGWLGEGCRSSPFLPPPKSPCCVSEVGGGPYQHPATAARQHNQGLYQGRLITSCHVGTTGTQNPVSITCTPTIIWHLQLMPITTDERERKQTGIDTQTLKVPRITLKPRPTNEAVAKTLTCIYTSVQNTCPEPHIADVHT